MRIYFASYNSKEWEQKPKYVLKSFQDGEKSCVEALNDVGKENFLLDSGAFAFMNGRKTNKKEIDNYIDSYIEFIKKYDVKYYIELDLDNLFGYEWVLKVRKKLEKSTMKKCIPVWHTSRGIEEYKKLVDNYDYIAIGGLVFHVKPKDYNKIFKMVAYAKKRGTRVHLLGFIRLKLFKKYNIYPFSCDSISSTLCGSRGEYIKFLNGELKTIRLKKENYNVKTEVVHKLQKINKIEMLKMQKWYDNY